MAQRIVIIDGSARNRRLLESLALELDDVEVVSFGRSAEALERAPTLDATLFIVDYRMPASDGMAILEVLRADQRTSLTPVVMVAGGEEREACYNALERGASDFLLRPIDRRVFRRRIGNLLALEAARHAVIENLMHLEAAARLNEQRIELIWRAAASSSDDETFLNQLLDDASKAIVEGLHWAGMITRLDDDEIVTEVANAQAAASGQGVGFHLRAAIHATAINSNAVDAVNDFPTERSGAADWRAWLFAPFQVGRERYFVGFLSTEPKEKPFTALDTTFIETIARLCAARLNQRAWQR